MNTINARLTAIAMIAAMGIGEYPGIYRNVGSQRLPQKKKDGKAKRLAKKAARQAAKETSGEQT